MRSALKTGGLKQPLESLLITDGGVSDLSGGMVPFLSYVFSSGFVQCILKSSIISVSPVDLKGKATLVILYAKSAFLKSLSVWTWAGSPAHFVNRIGRL